MKSRYIPELFVGDDEKWLLTGFDNNEKKEEATEAIQTVIAQYDRSLEFSGFRNQVGAAVSSLQKISPKTLKNTIADLGAVLSLLPS